MILGKPVMLWFIAILAATNLCAGYALGAMYGWSLLGGDAPDEAPTVKEKRGEQPSKNAQPAAVSADNTEASADAPPEAEPTPEATSSEELAAEGPSTEQVMEGLAAFQAQLAALGEELTTSDDDQSFDDCAGRMQQANHEYLDHAKDAIEQLDEATEVRDAVQIGAEEVQRASDEFDAALDAEEITSDLRDRLREISTSIVDSTQSVGEAAAAAASQTAVASAIESDVADQLAPGVEIDPDTGLATTDSMFARIDTLLEQAGGSQPLVIASVQADPLDEGEPRSEELTEQLLRQVAAMVDEVAGPAAAHGENQLLVALGGRSVDEASQQAEQIRQQVEATTFKSGEDETPLTISVALAQSTPEGGRDELLEHLDEALAEARRYGGNRSCHHDGKFPAPVMPEEIEIDPRTVTL